MTTEARVIEYHEAIGHPARSEPQTLSREEAILALSLIEEEYFELVEALFPGLRDDIAWSHEEFTPVERLQYDAEFSDDNQFPYRPNLIEVADALADLDVVVNGAGVRHGFDMQSLSREVFASNMSKLDADGKPIYAEPGNPNSKQVKGPNFRRPDIAGALGLAIRT